MLSKSDPVIRSFSFSIVLALLLLMTACETVHSEYPAESSRLLLETMTLPAQFKNDGGTVYAANLDAMVIRPDDGRRHPLVVINHAYSSDPQNVYPDFMRHRALEFARRGFVAVAFTRRGYGFSDGGFFERLNNCNESAIAKVGVNTADDIREVIRLMAKMPYVDASKVIAAGEEGGAYAAIALTADPPPGLVAAITFSAGRVVYRKEFLSCFQPSLNRVAAMFGKTSRIPMLWFYAEGDHYISVDAGRQIHKNFTEAGGDAELVVIPSSANVRHNFFIEGTAIWVPYVDHFLQKQGFEKMDQPRSVSDIRQVYGRT
jgi:dienelactone hydrolase